MEAKLHQTIIKFCICFLFLWTRIFHVHSHSTVRFTFYCEKLIFEKVGAAIYFCLFFKGK